MKRLPPIFALSIAVEMISQGSPCVNLSIGKPLRLALAANQPVCVLVSLTEGNALQIIGEDTADLKLETTIAGRQLISDGFEFGRETLTIESAGSFRVFATIPTQTGVQSVAISSRAMAAALAQRWRTAETLATKSKPLKNEKEIEASMNAWRALADPSSIARTQLKIGEFQHNAMNFRAAFASFEDSIGKCRSIGDTWCLAEAVNNSGMVADKLGNYQAAVARLNEAASIWRKLDKPRNESIAYSNLASAALHAGSFQQAISFNNRAASFPGVDGFRLANIWNSLALCYQFLGDYEKARNYFERAIPVFIAQNKEKLSILARANLGRNFMLAGDLQAAEPRLRQAGQDAAAIGDKSTLSLVHANLGQLLLQRRLPDEARSSLLNALLLHREMGDRRFEAIDLHYLGVIAAGKRDFQDSRDFLNQAVSISKASNLNERLADSLMALADLEVAAGNRDQGRKYGQQALELIELLRSLVPGPALRASFLGRKRKLFDLLVDLEPTPETTFLAAERGRGRALLDVLAEGSHTGAMPPALAERRRVVQQSIDFATFKLSTADARRVDDLRSQVDALVAEDAQIEARIRETQAAVKLAQPVQSAAAVQRQIPADAALIEYHLGEKQSYLWLITPSRFQRFALPPRSVIEAECRPLIDSFGNILGRRRSKEMQRNFERALESVSRILLGTMNGQTLPARVILVPDGILNRVPFAAIEWNGSRLGLKHDLVQIPSASFLVAGRRPRPVTSFPKTVLALADPKFGPGGGAWPFARLAFTKDVETLSALTAPSRRIILKGADANRSAVAAAPPGSFAFLHFSTHAIIDDKVPELSRLVLSLADTQGKAIDGFLRPFHLARWQLNGSTVVLSACETALGKQVQGEGLAGLTASLFEAGAARLILSLSLVDAEASATFFSEFYGKTLGTQPVTTEHAVTLARQALASSKRWTDPYHWASFVSYGRLSAE